LCRLGETVEKGIVRVRVEVNELDIFACTHTG
jgi:hypothetical protein